MNGYEKPENSQDGVLHFSIFEATIASQRKALSSNLLTSVELLTKYLIRISAYDIHGPCLNSFTHLNPNVLIDAAASDKRRREGKLLSPIDGIPYTLKDNFAYKGMPLSCGSPAIANLRATEDSFVAARLRAAGAILIGQTNMPPMAAGGMQRGLYGRAESPYNADCLTAAFSSGSSNGAATSLASSFAAFAVGSETVSSGRSPASNNGLVAWTPSRGVVSTRGLWPLYVTCDVVVPYTRCMEDMMEIVPYLTSNDDSTRGDFWRDQSFVKLPDMKVPGCDRAEVSTILSGKRIGIPRIYINQATAETDPGAKFITTNPQIIKLWETSKIHLESLGATVIECDFPLITNYEDDRISQQANNVLDTPEGWNKVERTILIAKSWDDFLSNNNDPSCPTLSQAEGTNIFPKPKNYLPDTFFEKANGIDYESLPALAASLSNTPIMSIGGLSQALNALENQRKRDFEEWLISNSLDLAVFPACADVAHSDLEFSLKSAEHALHNGVKYSNGNRAVRHLGIPTVSIPMGIMEHTKMPVNLTMLGPAYQDETLMKVASAFEQVCQGRQTPPRTPELASDSTTAYEKSIYTTDDESRAAIKIRSASRVYIPAKFQTEQHASELTKALYKVMLSGTLTLKCRDTLPILQVHVGGKKAFILSTESADREFYKSHLDCKNGTWSIEAEVEDWEWPLSWDLKKVAESEKVKGGPEGYAPLGGKILAVAFVKCGGAVDADFVLV